MWVPIVGAAAAAAAAEVCTYSVVYTNTATACPSECTSVGAFTAQKMHGNFSVMAEAEAQLQSQSPGQSLQGCLHRLADEAPLEVAVTEPAIARTA
eukprot:5124-Heterococcus_DN1.PRE.2